MMPQAFAPSAANPIIVPLHPATGRPCRRAEKHTGRHAFIWRFAIPGTVREVWEADCQVCGRPTTDGAVCRECGA